jgi:hypothetical protein
MSSRRESLRVNAWRAGSGQPRFIARLFAGLLGIFAAECYAQELSVLAGAVQGRENRQTSYEWALEYRHALPGPFAISAAWINQGHLENHHRDGIAAQGWLGTTAFDPRLTFSAGVGPYYYFDTTALGPDDPGRSAHGWGVLYSAAARWQFDRHWLVDLRVNRTEAHKSIDTTELLLGIGYRFDDRATDSTSEPHLSPVAQSVSELTFYAGRSVVNDFSSEGALAASIEYRRAINEIAEWSIAWLHEGQPRLARRNGVAAQIWVQRLLAEGRFTIGAGIGPFVAIDFYSSEMLPEGARERLAAVISLTASYRFDPHGSVRATWHRVASEDPFDSDVFLLGLGYRF